MLRREFSRLSIAAALLLPGALRATDPWPASDLLESGELAERMKAKASTPRVVCVAFPVLYRQRHIAGAVFAGPGKSPEAAAALTNSLAGVSKNTEVVLYCGCCPMDRCPNVRPAYRALKQGGYERVRVLHLATNFHDDWVAKGYPVST